MSLLRSRDLAFWLICVGALAALAMFAATRGSLPVPGGPSVAAIGAPAAHGSNAVPVVSKMLALMPSGVASGLNGAALTSWAGAVSSLAVQGATTRQSEGATGSDQMLAGFQRVSADCELLTAHAGEPVAASAARTQIGLDVDNLHLLAAGLPAPELPGTGLNPLNSGQLVAPPVPSAPPVPALPNVPEKTK